MRQPTQMACEERQLACARVRLIYTKVFAISPSRKVAAYNKVALCKSAFMDIKCDPFTALDLRSAALWKGREGLFPRVGRRSLSFFPPFFAPFPFVSLLGHNRRPGLGHRHGVCEHLSSNHNLPQALTAGLLAKLSRVQLRRHAGCRRRKKFM